MIEIMDNLMTADTIEERKRQLGSLLKADAEATNQRTNIRALCKYNENMILIMKEVTEGGANQVLNQTKNKRINGGKQEYNQIHGEMTTERDLESSHNAKSQFGGGTPDERTKNR